MGLTITRAALLSAALLVAASAATPAAAQSDILLRLRSGSPPGDRFRVDSAGGVVATGQLGIGIIPAFGAGYRMMWYPFKAAFRAGGIDGSEADYWDDGNVGFFSWAGGSRTRATHNYSFAFGNNIQVLSQWGAAFGGNNLVTEEAQAGFTAGYSNRCAGLVCTAIGHFVTASGAGSVALGYRTTADANYAVAIGYRASANGQTGAFVIADQSSSDSLEASASNQFSSRYAGGYRLFTNALMTTGVSLNAGGSSWNVISDRTRKEQFLAVDGEALLTRLRNVPVTTWRYIDETDRSVRHIGPMAQDWEAAFGFSRDSTTINQGDFDGVNLAGIQALERRTVQQAERIQALEQQVARLPELEDRVARLTELVERLTGTRSTND